jgi:hypothetical protein
MKRGVLDLTKSEVNSLLPLFLGQDSVMVDKLQASNLQEGEDIQVQFSEEEAEEIIDAIGIVEDSLLKSARTKVSTFLSDLRMS